jgi:undecaprenyl-diphosphatase
MVRRNLSNLLERLGLYEMPVLLGVLIVVAGAWGFVALTDVVLEGKTQSVDEAVISALRRPDDTSKPIGPDWMTEVARDLTALGGVVALVLITLTVAGYLLLDRKYAVAVFVLAAVVGGLVLSSILKASFDRPRPQIVPHLSDVYTSSFPSGHSMMSAIVYLTLGALLAHMVSSRQLKFYFLAVAMLLTGLVGISRVYMGVHYPTDVLAGWTAGLVWATVCLLAIRKLQRRGVIEKQARE